MGILADWQIRERAFITPFAEGIKRDGLISFGLTSYGYDCRIGYKFKVFSPIGAKEIDPKNFDPKALVDVDLTPIRHNFRDDYTCYHCGVQWKASLADKTDLCDIQPSPYLLIPPHSFVLGETLEEFDIPRDVLCVVLGKSTLARCGLIVNVTPLEPEWRGKVTVEISNTTPLPVRVYPGEGIMQCLFFTADYSPCEVSYKDKAGKYQSQVGLTLPSVDGK